MTLYERDGRKHMFKDYELLVTLILKQLSLSEHYKQLFQIANWDLYEVIMKYIAKQMSTKTC